MLVRIRTNEKIISAGLWILGILCIVLAFLAAKWTPNPDGLEALAVWLVFIAAGAICILKAISRSGHIP